MQEDEALERGMRLIWGGLPSRFPASCHPRNPRRAAGYIASDPRVQLRAGKKLDDRKAIRIRDEAELALVGQLSKEEVRL